MAEPIMVGRRRYVASNGLITLRQHRPRVVLGDWVVVPLDAVGVWGDNPDPPPRGSWDEGLPGVVRYAGGWYQLAPAGLHWRSVVPEPCPEIVLGPDDIRAIVALRDAMEAERLEEEADRARMNETCPGCERCR